MLLLSMSNKHVNGSILTALADYNSTIYVLIIKHNIS